MFKTTQMYLAAALTAATLSTASVQAGSVELPKHPELQQQLLMAKKAVKGDAKKEMMAKRAVPALVQLHQPKKLAPVAYSPIASAQTFFTKGRQAQVVRKAPAAVAETPTELLGYMSYSDTYEYGGYYSFKFPEGSVTPIAAAQATPNPGGFVADGVYKTIYIDDSYSFFGIYFFYLVTMDPETFEIVEAVELDYSTYGWYCLALTGTPTGNGFGLFYNDDASAMEYASVDFSTATKTVVAPATTFMIALASAADGTVYGLGEDNNLYTINTATGAETLVAAVDFTYAGADGAYSQSAAIDQKTGTMYWAAISSDASTSGLYTLDLTTGAATQVLEYGLSQIYGLAYNAPAAEEGAPAAAEDLTVSTEAAELLADVTFTVPTTTFGGSELTDKKLAVKISVNGEVRVEGTCKPGNIVTEPVQLEQGWNAVVVTLENSVGVGPKAKTNYYAGYDVPQNPADVALTISDEGVATVTWSPVTEGVNGAYVGTVTYNVYRVINGGAIELVAQNLAETTYSEALQIGTISNYVYGVEAVNGTQTSAIVGSNGVVKGDALEAPVTLNMATSFNLMTVVDVNEDGRTWAQSGEVARYSYSGANQADDWLYSPAIKLKADRFYTLKYYAFAQSDYFPETLEVTLSADADPASNGVSQTLVDAYIVPATAAETSAEFTVAAAGEYHVGFHCISDPDMFYLNLAYLTVEEAGIFGTPARALNLTAEFPEGKRLGYVSFDAPTTTCDGQPLTGVMKYTIYVDGEAMVIGSINAGASLKNKKVEAANEGNSEIKVVLTNSVGDGPAATINALVGEDVPASITESTITDLTSQVVLTWEPVTTGANGGWIDVNNISYEIYSIADGYISDLVLTTAETTATLDYNTVEGDAQLLQYAIRTVGAKGESGYAGTAATVVGEPVALPWIENFAGGSISNYMWLTKSADMTVGLSTAYNGGCGIFSAAAAASGELKTGKLSLAGTQNPEFIVDYTAMVSGTLSLVVYAANNVAEVIATTALQAGDQATLIGQIPASLMAEPWVFVSAYVETAEAGEVALTSYMVRDVLEYNLAVAINAPAKAVKGENFNVDVQVANDGGNAAVGARVVLTAGETTLSQVLSNLASFAVKNTVFTVPTSIFDENEEIEVSVKVEYDLDLKPEDNEASAVVALVASSAATVNDLAAEADEAGNVTLSWTVAEASYAEQTEGFESYAADDAPIAFPLTENPDQLTYFETWNEVGTLGPWTAYDLDGGSCYGWNSTAINWPYMGCGMGFACFDAVNVFGAAVEEPLANVNSGTKALICMNIAPAGGVSCNNDWLISPALPGIAQTISFYANELTDQYGHESFEVYYSTTNKEVDSFIKIGEGNTDAAVGFQQFSYELPEGARYFAIRVISADVFGMMIDDITFTAGVDAPVAFDIYRDQELLANTADNSYVDAAAPAGGHTYSVVAVYADGSKSAPVSIYFENAVGINTVKVEAAESEAYNVAGVRVNTNDLKQGVYVVGGQKVVK